MVASYPPVEESADEFFLSRYVDGPRVVVGTNPLHDVFDGDPCKDANAGERCTRSAGTPVTRDVDELAPPESLVSLIECVEGIQFVGWEAEVRPVQDAVSPLQVLPCPLGVKIETPVRSFVVIRGNETAQYACTAMLPGRATLTLRRLRAAADPESCQRRGLAISPAGPPAPRTPFWGCRLAQRMCRSTGLAFGASPPQMGCGFLGPPTTQLFTTGHGVDEALAPLR
jgi:hypothetical protein